MPYCPKCGSKSTDGDKFCRDCGNKLTSDNNTTQSNPKRKQVYEGSVHKCPHCGDTVPSFHSKCPSCGNEFRDTSSSSVVQKFSEKLVAIDAQPDPPKKRRTNANELTAKENQKIELIRSFPIPNTKEDLLEFLILASSNVDTIHIEGWNMSNAQKELSSAWYSKYDQAYQKAKILIKDPDELKVIETEYKNKTKSYKKSKRKSVYFPLFTLLFTLLFVIALDVVIFIAADIDNNKSEKIIKEENKRLELIVDEINFCINNEDYTTAKALTANLVFSAAGADYLDTDTASKNWDTIRNNLYIVIAQAEGTYNLEDNFLVTSENSEKNSLKTNEAITTIIDNSSNTSDNLVSTSNTAITNETSYSFMSDQQNIYVAYAISDSVIKIEHWKKSFSSKKSKYDSDLGTYKIDDEDFEFTWLDEQQTAFSIKLQDKSNSHIKKPKTVKFTININDDDKNKGSNYNNNITCYSYQENDLNLYRVILLTDSMLKIECWKRNITIEDFRYGYDVDVLNIHDTDFEWLNNEHQSFTISIQDKENKKLKNSKFVSFFAEKEENDFADIYSYISNQK